MFIAWNPLGFIVEELLEFLVGILLFLDSIVYSLINWVYQIILVLCQINILEDTFEIDALINRIYVIIGVIVLFLLAYSLLRSLANPDEDLKGKKSPVNIIKEVIISITLIALVPSVFNFAMEFQRAVLVNNTIGKLVLGTSNTVNQDGSEMSSDQIIEQGGMEIASNVLLAFLHPNYSNCTVDETSTTGYDCSNINFAFEAYGISGEGTFDEFWESAVVNGSLLSISDLADNIVDGDVTYYYIISTIAGVFVFIILLSYCIDVALRTIKLAIFQMIAPLPILSRLMPNDDGKKVFSDWLKATISTYVEVFVRLAILFFAVLLIKIVTQNFTNIFAPFVSGSDSWTVVLFAQLFVIIGIILFIREAPKILKDITGLDSGKYGKSIIRGVGMLGTAVGGGATAAIRRAVTDKTEHPEMGRGRRTARILSSLGGGMTRGLWHGSKTEKFSDIPKSAGKSATNTLNHTAQVDAAGGGFKGMKEYYKQKGRDTHADIQGWLSGSFEAQQKLLEQVDAFVKDAKAVKSTSEGFIKEKKYLFNFGEDVKLGEREVEVDSGIKDKDGNAIMAKRKVARAQITKDTTLSEMEAMIQSLKSSGDVEDAKIAAALESKLNQKIKTIGKKLAEVAVDRSKAKSFDEAFSSSASKGILNEAMVALDQTKSAYEIVQKKFTLNQALDGVQNFKNDKIDGGTLTTENVSKLADYLESQSSKIQENIKLEQERRKAASQKGGNNK